MSTRSKTNRRNDKMLCRTASKADVIQPSSEELRIAQQEFAMWSQYRGELDRIARTPVGEPDSESFVPHEDIEDMEENPIVEEPVPPLDGSARYEITDLGPSRLYPTGKSTHTSKDKHYGPIVRKSDKVKSKKQHGKPKGRSFSQLKKSGSPLTEDDIG